MRSREIRLHALVKFVNGYTGEPGALFRRAIADYFGVSPRTVESELPRAVKQGVLQAETLPGRGAPKIYRLTQQGQELIQRKNGNRFRKHVDLIRTGDLPQPRNPWFTLFERHGFDKATAELFEQAFRNGIVAYCPVCSMIKVIPRLPSDTLPIELWPVCPGHHSKWDADSESWTLRYMISAWSMGLLTPCPTAPKPQPKEPFSESCQATRRTR